MVEVEHIEVYPLLVEVPVDDQSRVGLVSLTVVPPNHASLRITSITADPDNVWDLPMLNVSCDDGPLLEPLGVGGGGGEGWMRWDADFLGHVSDSIGLVEISFVDRHSATELAVVSVTPQASSSPDVADSGIDDVNSLLADDHGSLLPTWVAPVRSAIEGVANHVVVSVEHWARTSVILVYTPDPHQQMPSVASVAVGRDSIGRTYDVRSEGGGTWCGGAASYLRVTPRLPSDVDALCLERSEAPFDRTPVTLQLR